MQPRLAVPGADLPPDAPAILIFPAQVPEMLGVTWHSYAMIALGPGIIHRLSTITTAIPSALICIVVLP